MSTESEVLRELAGRAALFRTPSDIAYADLLIDGHRETWPVRGPHFRAWLCGCYYRIAQRVPSRAAVMEALNQLEATARFDGAERPVHIRVAEHAGYIYLDLADREWRAVEIGVEGWQVVSEPPVRFLRPRGMLPLPVPDQGGSIDLLDSLLNLPDRDHFVLVVTWLLAALRPSSPFPLLAVSGEQGSGKTVLSKLLKALVDPNTAPARAMPRDTRELMIAANNAHVLTLDNLSHLPAWLSDALCRLATRGGFAVRRLYTDDDEVLFEAARPVLLNGIEDLISRADLADRAIFLTLPPIGEEQRRPETELWRQFEAVRPRILGVLLDAVAHGLRELPRVRPRCLPRMADFAIFAMASETKFWPKGTFAQAYANNRRAAAESAMDADAVTACVRQMLAEHDVWRGTAADLLRIGSVRGNRTDWPKSPLALANRLRRAQPLLREAGITMAFTREGRAGNRTITLTRTPETTVRVTAGSSG